MMQPIDPPAPEMISTWCNQIDHEGFVVLPDVLSDDEVARYRDALDPWISGGPKGRNTFEGRQTHRVYGLLAKDACFADLITHPIPLAIAEALLGKSCLLSACLAIDLQPGESHQPWHTDDGHISVSPPHEIFGISAFWALDDTTEENGATEVLPQSHRWAETDFPGALKDQDFADQSAPDASHDPGFHPDAVKVTMKAGSLMIARGDLWHRGGANVSGSSRLIVTPQYCAGWARPLETMLLAVSPEVVGTLPIRARELLGYSIHQPFMGYVDGMHPARLLDAK
jgi:ectoine hydroxylase-related dioxygenase (phytanoyl-CoA dioxygenase family)